MVIWNTHWMEHFQETIGYNSTLRIPKKKKKTNTYPRLKRTETLWLWPFWLTGARNRPQMMEIQRDKRPESGSMNPGRSTVTRSPPPTHFSFGSNRDLELSGLWCFRLTMVSYKFKKTSCHNSCQSPFRKSSSVVQTINQPWLGMRQLLVETPVMATHGNMSGLTMAFPRCFWTNHLHIPEDHIVSNYISQFYLHHSLVYPQYASLLFKIATQRIIPLINSRL